MTPQDVVRVARTWIGTRFLHQASLKGVGCDCIGLIAGVARELGMPEAEHWLRDARRRSYTKEPSPAMLLAAASEYLLEVPLEALRVGDVPLFRVRTNPQHFGILSAQAPRYLIHAHGPSRAVVENGFDGHWSASCVKVYRYRALT